MHTRPYDQLDEATTHTWRKFKDPLQGLSAPRAMTNRPAHLVQNHSITKTNIQSAKRVLKSEICWEHVDWSRSC
eukprot:12163266-Prorocentrum_lima.AAC.1